MSQEDPYDLETSKYRCLILHPSNEWFPVDIVDVEGIKNDTSSPMYPDFACGKKLWFSLTVFPALFLVFDYTSTDTQRFYRAERIEFFNICLVLIVIKQFYY